MTTPRKHFLMTAFAAICLLLARDARAYVTNEWALYANGAPGVPVNFATDAMMNIQQGFCYFTHIQGQFEGGGEGGQLWVGSDGNWRMKVWAQQPGIGFRARCATWDSFPNSANHVYTVNPRWDYSTIGYSTPVWGLDSICLLDLLTGQYSEANESAGTTSSPGGFFAGPIGTNWLNVGAASLGVVIPNGALVESGTFCLNLGHAAHLAFATQGFNYDFIAGAHEGGDVKMIGTSEGLCWLNGIQGGYDGGGEQATIYIGADNHWHLQQLSQQPGNVTGSMASCAYFQ